jgi:predicted DNA-binding transcriptional regulator YafY
MNRTDRLVAMVMFMQGRRLVKAYELAAHFEICARTVYRDMAALSEAGVPIAGEAGVGYSLVKGYHLPPVMLTADEASALFVGAEMVKQFTDASLGAPMTSALDKLRAVLPRDRQDHVERLARQTMVMGRSRNNQTDPPGQPWLLQVQRGVVNRQVLRLNYRGKDRNEPTLREVEPLGAVYYGSAWYLVAWCRLRNDFRQFRLDRIRDLYVEPDQFEHRPDFCLREFMERESKGEKKIHARVWISEPMQGKARAESYATLIEEGQRDGGAEFSIYTASIEWLAWWLLSFGPAAVAVGPAKLRKRVRELAKVTLANYEK